MLYSLIGNGIVSNIIGILFAFVVTLVLEAKLAGIMPHDQGREFAVDGSLSKGKVRGVGLIFVSVYILTACLFANVTREIMVYLVLIFCGMMTGYLDDAAKVPWGELKKGLLDLVIAILIAVNYLYFHTTEVTLALFDCDFKLPIWLYGILIVILVWAMINVTNCTDGVDGLSATLVLVSLASISIFGGVLNGAFNSTLGFFMAVLIAYLWFNATPSTQLMGDAGSRAMGLVLAIAILMTGSPFMILLFAFVIIVDGGIGLFKVTFIRVTKINPMKNITTPLHDHFRKKMGWSNTQVVYRFAIVQIMISWVAIYLSMM